MAFNMDYEEQEVLVVGGGTAGVIAAIAAARTGAKVLLIELNGLLGGTSTAGMVSSFLTFHNMKGEQIARGIPQEVVDRLLKRGGAVPPGHLRNPYGNAFSVTPFDAEALKYVLMDMCREAGVQLLLRTMGVDAIVANNTIKGVVVTNKAGWGIVLSRVVIDCSGDADVAAAAAVPCEKGRRADGLTMPMTLTFRLGNVRTQEIVDYVKAHPDQFILGEDPYIREGTEEIVAGIETFRDVPLLTGFFDLIEEKKKTGEFPKTRERLIIEITPHEGVLLVNTSNVLGRDGTDPRDLTAAQVEGMDQVHQLVEFFRRYVPGFSECSLIDTAAVIGVRETRRIVGEYTLTGEDVLKGRGFPDGIGKGAYCMDIHEPDGTIRHLHIEEGRAYDIPYRCLVPKKVDNLLVAGRCISVTREALGSTRNQVPCMVTGQAAGTAAALCVADAVSPGALDPAVLRASLRDQGVIL